MGNELCVIVCMHVRVCARARVCVCVCVCVCASHLVRLVHVVARQRDQQVLKPRHVVVIDGVDDGLHHKGVFFVLFGASMITYSWRSQTEFPDFLFKDSGGRIFIKLSPDSLSDSRPVSLFEAVRH